MKSKIPATLSAVALVILSACGGTENRERPSEAAHVVPAQVEIIGITPMQVTYEAVGTVRSKTTSTISPKVTGHIMAIYVNEGDQVTTGQLLIQIDDRDAAARLSKAQAGLDEARNALEEARRAIQAAESAKAAAEAQRTLATSTYQRYKELLERNSVSQQEFDETNAKYKAAVADAERADEFLQSVKAKRRQAAAKIEQAKAGVIDAQVYLAYTKLPSPIAGLVTTKHADIGNLAQPGTPLLTVEDNRHYRLEATVQESQANRIQLGHEVPVTITALGDAKLLGKVAEIVPTADPASRSSIVKLDLPSHPSVRSGMFGKAEFPVGQKQGITVPLSAIIQRGQLTGVFVVDQADTARLRLVKTGKQYGNRVEVLSGLNQGETVVSENVEHVREGNRISH